MIVFNPDLPISLHDRPVLLQVVPGKMIIIILRRYKFINLLCIPA